MSEIKTLYDAGVVADDAFAALNQSISALIVTLESMDDDGLQPRAKESPALAINFAARFPMYSDALHLILRHMGDSLDTLRAGTDGIFAASAKQREAGEVSA